MHAHTRSRRGHSCRRHTEHGNHDKQCRHASVAEQALLDDPDAYANLIAELRHKLENARRQRDLLLAWRLESARQAGRIRSMWELAEAAADRLPSMTDDERTEILAILDIRVTVLDPPPDAPARGGSNGGYGPATPRLRIEGSVPHQQLLEAFVPGWTRLRAHVAVIPEWFIRSDVRL